MIMKIKSRPSLPALAARKQGYKKFNALFALLKR
jgi:hypothetical protein